MENIGNIILGIMIPFGGTTLGAACVYFMKKGIRQNVEKGLLGFAAGVMVAASDTGNILAPRSSFTGQPFASTRSTISKLVNP